MRAALFPGQGAQTPGMCRELFDGHAAFRETFEAVSDSVGRSLADVCFTLSEDELRQTQNAQIALFACGVGAHRCLPAGDAFAGHSVGEYAALVCSGTLDLTEGARLVNRRAEIMAKAAEARPGTMAAVLKLGRDAVEALCRDASRTGSEVVCANDNCPGQIVVSGDTEAVQRLIAAAPEAGGKAMTFPVGGAFHSPLMAEAAAAMGVELAGARFVPAKAVYDNLTAQPEPADRFQELLRDQIAGQVRWTETMQNLHAAGADVFIEYGAGKPTLGTFIGRTLQDVVVLTVRDEASLAAASEALL